MIFTNKYTHTHIRLLLLLLLLLLLVVFIKKRCIKYNRRNPFTIEDFANIDVKNKEIELNNKLIKEALQNKKDINNKFENLNKYYLNIMLSKIFDYKQEINKLLELNKDTTQCDNKCQIINLNKVKNIEIEIKRINKIIDEDIDLDIENKDDFIKNLNKCIKQNKSLSEDKKKQCVIHPAELELLNEKELVQYIKNIEDKIESKNPDLDRFICKQCKIQEDSNEDLDVYIYGEDDELEETIKLDEALCNQSCKEVEKIEKEISIEDWKKKQALLDKKLQYMKEHQTKDDDKSQGMQLKSLKTLFNPEFKDDENPIVVSPHNKKLEQQVRTYYIFRLLQYKYYREQHINNYNNITVKNKKKVQKLLDLNKNINCTIDCTIDNLKKVEVLNQEISKYGNIKVIKNHNDYIKRLTVLINYINIDNKTIIERKINYCLKAKHPIKTCIQFPVNKDIKDVIDMKEKEFMEFIDSKYSDTIGSREDSKLLSRINYNKDSYNITGFSKEDDNINDIVNIPNLPDFYDMYLSQNKEDIGFIYSNNQVSPHENNIYKTQYYQKT